MGEAVNRIVQSTVGEELEEVRQAVTEETAEFLNDKPNGWYGITAEDRISQGASEELATSYEADSARSLEGAELGVQILGATTGVVIGHVAFKGKGQEAEGDSGGASSNNIRIEKDISQIKGTKAEYSPVNHGPLGDPNDTHSVASTFRSGTYSQIVTDQPVTLYRVYGGKSGPKGTYWTTVKPKGPAQTKFDSALLSEWGNNANKVIKIEIPAGTRIFQGKAAAQTGVKKQFENVIGGGDQIYIPKKDLNSKWFENAETFDFSD